MRQKLVFSSSYAHTNRAGTRLITSVKKNVPKTVSCIRYVYIGDKTKHRVTALICAPPATRLYNTMIIKSIQHGCHLVGQLFAGSVFQRDGARCVGTGGKADKRNDSKLPEIRFYSNWIK